MQDQYNRAPFLLYSHSQCLCTIQENAIYGLGLDDCNRTDIHPLPRVDTIGTGFDIVDSGNYFNDPNFDPKQNEPFRDAQGNETFRFRVNKYYCDDFKLKFDGENCYEPIGEKIFGFLVSSTLYKACQYGVRYLETGVTNSQIQKLNLPPVEHDVRHKTIDSWLADIDYDNFFLDPDVTLTDLGITAENRHLIFTTQYGYPGRLVEPLLVYSGVEDVLPIDYEKLNEGRLPQFKYDPLTGRRVIDEYEILGIYKVIRENPTKLDFQPSSFNNPGDQLIQFFKGISDNIVEVGSMLVAGILVSKATDYSLKVIKLSSEYLQNVVTPTLLFLVQRQMLFELIEPIKTVLKQALVALKAFSSLIKTVDVVTTIAGIVDLFDLKFDFFNMTKVLSDGTLRQYAELDIDSIRKGYGYGTVEFSAIHFILRCEEIGLYKNWRVTPTNTRRLRGVADAAKYSYMLPIEQVLDPHEDTEKSFNWISEYIFSLQTNANYLTINWEDENILADDVVNQYLDIRQSVYLQGMDRYGEFTRSFRRRYNLCIVAIVVFILLFILVLFFNISLSILGLFSVAIGTFYLTFTYVEPSSS